VSSRLSPLRQLISSHREKNRNSLLKLSEVLPITYLTVASAQQTA
jgi:hypothetical protein